MTQTKTKTKTQTKKPEYRPTFKGALAFLQGKERRKLDNNTYLEAHHLPNEGGTEIAVRLHDTDIVTFRKDGTATLKSGGWRTLTTRSRINEYGPVSIQQVKGVWYVIRQVLDKPSKSPDYPTYTWVKMGLFQDGMKIGARGGIVGHKERPSERKTRASDKRRAEIREYATAFLAAFKEGQVPMPSRGDCWDCAFKTADGTPMGDLSKSGHVAQHVKEGYFAPSLLLNAVLEAKYGSPEWVLGVRKIGDATTWGGPSVLTGSLYRSLVKYLYKRAGFEATHMPGTKITKAVA